MRRTLCSALVFLSGIGSPLRPADAPLPDVPTFKDIAKEAGLAGFKHSCGDNDMDNIAEATGVGACIFDFDGDGDLDIYFPNGRWTQGVSDNRGRNLIGKLRNALYRNDGNGTFSDVTEAAGVQGKGAG